MKSTFTSGVPGEDEVDINYKHGSYLFLARKDAAHLLEQNIAVQREADVKVNRFGKFHITCQQFVTFHVTCQ